jgi:hypothetical protein
MPGVEMMLVFNLPTVAVKAPYGEACIKYLSHVKYSSQAESVLTGRREKLYSSYLMLTCYAAVGEWNK